MILYHMICVVKTNPHLFWNTLWHNLHIRLLCWPPASSLTRMRFVILRLGADHCQSHRAWKDPTDKLYTPAAFILHSLWQTSPFPIQIHPGLSLQRGSHGWDGGSASTRSWL